MPALVLGWVRAGVSVCSSVSVARFWREVFDLSDRVQTPARSKAGMLVCATIGLVVLAVALAVGVASGWSSQLAINLLFLPWTFFVLAVGSYLQLRRLRRSRSSRE